MQEPLARRALEAQHIPSDIVSLSNNVLYLEDGAGNRIIFDAGNGPRPDFGPGLGRLVGTLEAQGIRRESITHVLLSHGHLDHCGGVLLDTSGTQAFPKATVYMSRLEYEYWRGNGQPFNKSDIDQAYLGFLADAANDVINGVRRHALRAQHTAEQMATPLGRLYTACVPVGCLHACMHRCTVVALQTRCAQDLNRLLLWRRWATRSADAPPGKVLLTGVA